jgi:hypothetical protein
MMLFSWEKYEKIKIFNIYAILKQNQIEILQTKMIKNLRFLTNLTIITVYYLYTNNDGKKTTSICTIKRLFSK